MPGVPDRAASVSERPDGLPEFAGAIAGASGESETKQPEAVPLGSGVSSLVADGGRANVLECAPAACDPNKRRSGQGRRASARTGQCRIVALGSRFHGAA